MSDRFVDKLVDTGNTYSQDEWVEFEETYFEKLGFESKFIRVPLLGIQIHPSITGRISDPNWLHFLPDNTVDRLLSSENLNTELPTIINETYESVTSELDIDVSLLDEALSAYDSPSESSAQIKGILAARIVRQLSGHVDFDKIRTGVSFPTEPQMDLTQDRIDILVKCHLNRNFQDIEIYSIENRAAFFDTAFGDGTYMFEKLRQSNLRPEFTVENVAFEIEGYSWYHSDPPTDSIVYKFTDQKGRVDFYEIENPSKMFGDSWGDIDAMRSILNKDGGEHVGCSSGDWTMSLGMQL